MWRSKHFLIFLSLFAVTVFGIWSKFYTGVGREWLNNSFGGVLYEILWCLFFFAFFPRKKAIAAIAVSVFVGTCALEFLQLVKTPWLDAIRATLIGRLLLGTTFVPSDFIYYAIGSFLGWLWMLSIEKSMNRRR
ncbi:DUF2809 domain-containing protein [Oscillatoria sp. FACHB-1406]|uniref:ribosomal maturation YjgA family protein n=1 Tax=Oscillatoria sp. FACHB-1406 TaxID=2692846 RepID=UPI0016898F86|nr:DUF2809 domain-containing protein [Oscillatoria sp. FACHB-1406]MBD2578113.1 DUF2809 domain-containing protein [Oscillatoria sp. FACHB-1406]